MKQLHFGLSLTDVTKPILLLAILGTFALAAPSALRPAFAGPATAVCAAAPPAGVETAAATSSAIQVTVENVIDSNGLITAVLYSDDRDTFLKKGARLDRIRVEAREGETVLCLQAPSVGRYSIALYHDRNGNKKLDRNFLGIPTEGFGFSQNPGFRLGKPDVEETLFSTDGGLTTLNISILYL